MTQYGHEHYTADPVPLHQRQTLGEIPIVKPCSPVTEPLAHSGQVRGPIDQLHSHSQRAIERYCDEILTVISGCRCDLCKNCVKMLLSDLIGEVLTDTTIVTLALGKQQREFERFTDAIVRLMPNILGREGRQ